MAAQTGRTVGRWFKFQVDDSAGTVRDIPVSTISGVGLSFEEKDLTALQDAVKGALPGQPDMVITITGPWDTTAAVAASGSAATPTLSGSHTVLNGINGLSTPLTFGAYQGVRHNWETGEPTFGITSSATTGALCFEYTIDPAAGTYSAKFRMFPGSPAPAWGTAAYT